MRQVHLIAGLFGIVAFLGTGLYMHFAQNHLYGMEVTPRLIYRSGHINFLFSALINTALGLYQVPALPGWRSIAQLLGSCLLLLAPVLLLTGFFVEPWLSNNLERPYARPGIYLSLAGVLMHLISRWPKRSAPNSA